MSALRSGLARKRAAGYGAPVLLAGLLAAVPVPTAARSLAQDTVRDVRGRTPPAADAVAVVRGMVEAFNAGDEQAVLDYFSDDFRLTLDPDFPSTAVRTDSGAAFLREWVRELIDGDFRIEVEVLEADGGRVRTRTTTWQDITRWTGMAPVVGIEDYVIEDGRITHLTWTAADETWDRFYAFRTRAVAVLGVVTLLLLGGVWWLARRLVRRPRA